VPGVFAIGAVHAGLVKRAVTVFGNGAQVVAVLHAFVVIADTKLIVPARIGET
jgi:thioredoxin reductase